MRVASSYPANFPSTHLSLSPSPHFPTSSFAHLAAIIIPMKEFQNFTIQLARAAGAVLLEWFEGDFQQEIKSTEFDIVTEADKASDRLVLAEIQAHYPDHVIWTEESGYLAGDSAFRWVVDPLDGTTNFAHGVPHFAVSLALQKHDETILGVVYDPIRDELFWAQKGAGAWLEREGRPARRLQVTQVTELRSSLLATGFPYSRANTNTYNGPEFQRVLRRIRGIRRLASPVLDLAYVAAGRFDGYWEYHLFPWEGAAGALLVTEAGGMVRQLDGSPWHLEALSMVATNPSFMSTLTAALRGEE